MGFEVVFAHISHILRDLDGLSTPTVVRIQEPSNKYGTDLDICLTFFRSREFIQK
jgi:hypothetical protein